MRADSSTPFYRPEIDGLRALAVAAVIINHIEAALLPGGYLGVDIFFVISGYVITSSLENHGSNSFREFLLYFYVRRIRRLMPALILFVVVASFFICLFNPQPVSSIRTGVASLLGLSNLYLLSQSTNYFAESTRLNIFTHTWSLGVEEQFYLVFPALFWVTGFGRHTLKGTRNLFGLTLILSLVSLTAFIILYPTRQSVAYFLMPTRLWELGSGCLLYVALSGSIAGAPRLENIPPILPTLGILVVLFAPLSLAVPATIAVVVLTVTLIACLRPGLIVYRIFAAQQVVYIGLISYSLYLWHWGVLAISRWTIGIHWWSIPFQVIVMLIFAIVSYRYVETPIRRSIPSSLNFRRIFYVMGAASAALVSLLLLSSQSVHQRLYTGNVNAMEIDFAATKTATSTFSEGCNIYEDEVKALTISESCGIQTAARNPTIYLLGDSHIFQFRDAVEIFALERNYNTRLVWGNGCMFPSAIIRGELDFLRFSAAECFKRQDAVGRTLLRDVKAGDIVIIGSALYAHFSSDWPGWQNKLTYFLKNGTSLSVAAAAEVYSSLLKDLAERLIERGAKVVIYLDSAQFPQLERDEMCQAQLFYSVPTVCKIEKSFFLKRRDDLFGWLKKWSDGSSRIVWDGLDVTTCGTSDYCIATHYKDSNHFKDYYASYIFKKFVEEHPFLF